MVSAAVFLGFREDTLLILQGFGFSGFRRLRFALWLLALFIFGGFVGLWEVLGVSGGSWRSRMQAYFL